MCLSVKGLIPNCTVPHRLPALSPPQDAYGTLILALIKNSVPYTLYLIFLKYISFFINFTGKVTRLVNLLCNKIQNIYLSFTKLCL